MCYFRNDFVFFLIALNYCSLSNSQDNNIVPYKSVDNCKKSEYYDLDLFKCIECDAKNHLVPSADRSQCVCQSDFFQEVIYDSVTRQPICKDNNCIKCSKPEQPKCKLKYINSVRNGTTQKGVQIFRDDSKNCSCDVKLNTVYHDFCISLTLLKNLQHFNLFHPERPIFADLKFVVFFCKVLRNSTACNHLANLCVAAFYSLAKNSPCSLFYVSQAADTAVYGDDEMDNVRPFLFYKKGISTRQDLGRTIDYSYSLVDGDNGSNFLKFVMVVYTLDGKIHKIGELSPHSVNMCHRNILSEYNSYKFAQNYNANCKFTLDHLIEMGKTEIGNHFYSIFLNYTIESVSYLQQVPLLVRNAYSINEGHNPSDWQLVKRFQLFDSETTPSRISQLPLNYVDSTKLIEFKMIRYIDSFHIDLTIKDENRITSPFIILHYTTIEINPNNTLNYEYNYRFGVRFMKTQNLHFYFELFLPLATALGLAFSILRTFNYKTRQNKEYYDFSALCQFVLFLFSNCANAFFSVAMIVCFYAFFVFTGQNTVKLLMPIQQQQHYIDVLLIVAFILKTIYLTAYYWRIVHADIFFIDWERPKGYDAPSTVRSNLETPSVCSSVRTTCSESVSAWRNFFVANEWIKISAKRKTSVLVQSISLIICLEIGNSNFSLETRDKTLKLAILILLQLVLYAGQICLHFLVVERIYGNPLQQFIDVCSMANISVFLLLHDSYGFYIHGRSPHGFSDTDMSSMIIQLQREAQSMCGKRGLLTGSDNQTYIILVPMDLRVYYEKLLTPFQKAVSISQTHFEKEFSQNKSLDYPLEKTSAAYSNVNRFFCAFIDHSIKDLDYIIKERSFTEILLDCEFDSYSSGTKGTFYIDNWSSFGNVLLYGNDTQLFLFDLMLFCCIFVLSNNPVVSAFVTSIFYKIFQIVFRSSIKTNVANKTLIDKRFLI